MDSGRPRVFRLSESSPPSNFDSVNEELNNGNSKDRKPKKPLNILGTVKEKGFWTQTASLDRVSVPRPRVTPFPVARHRSDGPHWGPPSTLSCPAADFKGDDEGVDGSAAKLAEPLGRRKESQPSLWRSNRKSERDVSVQTQNEFDDIREVGNSRETSATVGTGDQPRKVVEVVAREKEASSAVEANPKPYGIQQSVNGVAEPSKLSKNLDAENKRQPGSIPRSRCLEDLEKRTPNPVQTLSRPASLEKRGPGEQDVGPAKQAHQPGLHRFKEHEIDAENRELLFSMSSEEVAEAQAELSQKIRPEILEVLRRRGEEKEKKRLSDEMGTGPQLSGGDQISKNQNDLTASSRHDMHPTKVSVGEDWCGVNNEGIISISGVQTASKGLEVVRGTKIGPADLLAAAEEDPSDMREQESTIAPTTDPWTLRVEAVRAVRFDLDGTVISSGPAPLSASQYNSTEGITANSQHNILNVVERDYLRTGGDPVGSGYLLKEAIALVRSTVAGQRAVALRLVASVLDKAVYGLQYQKFNPCPASHHECLERSVDWQAIWAYALGPEAEVVLTLRLALDDGHSTVVAACARAIQALLSYTANEIYFDSLEACWPGDRVVYTAPIFRRKTKQTEGFIGGGYWKYNVKAREMFPFSGTSAQEKVEEDGKDTVADDGHISNKDVAAGLIRMGVLPRIRYILEVDKLIAAEEALLSVLICMARHSPTAANAVMKCPRLIDAILLRFIGTDKDLPEEGWSARLKAIRLLKVLSQSRRTYCLYFEGTGALYRVMRPLLQQRYAVKEPADDAQDQDQGFYQTMIETLRFWRICIDYGVGISLFSDCYPTLCFWLVPLSEEEILTTKKDKHLLLALESYLLLEHLAKTLPILHAKLGRSAKAEPSGLLSWSWGVATAMVHTAIKWLSPQCISGVKVLLEQSCCAHGKDSQEAFVLNPNSRNVVGILAAVLHFLATVCEKVVSEQELTCAVGDLSKSGLPWLPAFVPELGLALARSGLLSYSDISGQLGLEKSALVKKDTLMEYLCFCNIKGDEDSALVAINCLGALVRISVIVDKLICIAKPRGIAPLGDQTLAHRILDHGLLSAAKSELRNLLVLCEENVITTSHLIQMSVRGGPAPGLGIGWGSLSGGAWSKQVMIVQASVRLTLDLIPILSSSHSLEKKILGAPFDESSNEFHHLLSVDPTWRINFGLGVVATSTPLNRELVLKVISGVLFHPSTLSVMVQKSLEALVSWSKRSFENVLQDVAVDQQLDPDYLSKVLLHHCRTFWLAVKKRKSQDEACSGKYSNKMKTGLGELLTTIDEEAVDDCILLPESLMQEWVGQRLPLPSHWFLSPLVVDILQTSRKDWVDCFDSKSEQTTPLEEFIKAGLAFFLGFEVLRANVSDAVLINAAVPLVRKIHTLSTLFVSGGDSFLHPLAQNLIGTLQNFIGDQILMDSISPPQNGVEEDRSTGDILRGLHNLNHEKFQSESREQNVGCEPNWQVRASKLPILDFESSIDASYLNYMEIFVEHFVAASYGDFVFARQVALHLWLNIPVNIRLAVWRVLSDARILELLPPLNKCYGQPEMYLYPLDDNQQMLESFVSAWASGALDKAAKRGSLPFTLALHHLSGSLFCKIGSEEVLLSKRKTLRTLVRSSVRKSDRQEMLLSLVRYVAAWPCSEVDKITEEAESQSRDRVKSRLLFLLEACEGDASLITEVQRVQSLLLC